MFHFSFQEWMYWSDGFNYLIRIPNLYLLYKYLHIAIICLIMKLYFHSLLTEQNPN